MLAVGDTAPDFTAPLVSDETEPFRFSNRRGSGPVVLAFFPAAFSSTCTEEFCTLRDDLSEFADLDVRVLGISTDLPYALRRFRAEHNLPFDLVSDNDGTISAAYDVIEEWEHIALKGVSQRAVFVLDAAGSIRYVWRAEDPGQQPEYDALIEAIEAATEN